MTRPAKARAGFYGTQAWRALRARALKRDGHRCTRCASRHRLTVNHRISRRERPDLQLELANLETLCAACDNKFHREKGHGTSAFGCTLEGWPLDPRHHWNTPRRS
jgi:5-methylcytosine-specific restriction enzyme A